MKFTKEEKAYIQQELNLEPEEGEKIKNQVYVDWLQNDINFFEGDNIEVLENRIEETEALVYHYTAGGNFEQIKSLRLKAQNSVLIDKIDEREAILELKKVKKSERVAAEKKAKARKSESNK